MKIAMFHSSKDTRPAMSENNGNPAAQGSVLHRMRQNHPLPAFAAKTLTSIQKRMNPNGWWMLALVALVAALFGKTLVSPGLMISAPGADGNNFFYFVHMLAREGFSNGELVSWNPYILCGTPVTGTFQYALLYPPHWLCLLLPSALSMNWLLFLHVCLAGLGMYGWCVFRGLKPAGAFLAGLVYMLSGAYIAHAYVGHFTLLYAGTWIPLVFWGIDGWLRRGRARWLLLASGAAAAQVYAGFPQFFYYTALASGLWSLTELFYIDGIRKKTKAALGLLAIYPLATLLAAAELLPGYLLVPETLRGAGTSYAFGAMASLQFKNLLLLLVPGFYGHIGNHSFWDNEFLHEIFFYCGLGGLLMALIGWWQMKRGRKLQYAVLLAILLLFALGGSIPRLYMVFHDYIPLFGSFRSTGRFTVFISLLVALLAGMGLSRMLEGETAPRWLMWRAFGAGAFILVCGLLLRWGALGGAYHALADWATTHPGYRQNLAFPDRQKMAEMVSAGALCWSGVVMLALVALVFFARKKRRLAVGLFLAVSTVEMMVFARPLTPFWETKSVRFDDVAQYISRYASEERSLNTFFPNANILFQSGNIWGYDGVFLRRTIEYITASQNMPLDFAITTPIPKLKSRMFELLRGRYALVPNPNGKGIAASPLSENPMPRFSVINRYFVAQDRDKILAALKDERFDYRKAVILEKNPGIPLSPQPIQYTVSTRLSSLNRYEIEVNVSAPGILLMTDAYATGWHASALPGSVQTNYDLQPADWMVRGIPLLKPGKHIIEIKYTPPGFIVGMSVSLATLAALAIFAAFTLRRRILAKLSPQPAPIAETNTQS